MGTVQQSALALHGIPKQQQQNAGLQRSSCFRTIIIFYGFKCKGNIKKGFKTWKYFFGMCFYFKEEKNKKILNLAQVPYTAFLPVLAYYY